MDAQAEVDVVVLGVGTCGEDLSLRLLDAGLAVAGVEAALVGGECPYWACLPSKRMIRNGNLVAETRRADGRAGQASIEPDWATVAAQVRAEVTGGWDDSYGVERFGKRGGTLIKGHGRLTGPKTVSVGDRTLVARRGVVIATGSQATTPPIPGLADVAHWTTHDVIAAEELPDSLIVLGGGAVGCELGQLLARFGVDVTIVEASERVLVHEEPEVSAAVAEALTAEGMTLVTGARVVKVEAVDGSVLVASADRRTWQAEQLLVAIGRQPRLSDLGLEAIGLDPDAGRIGTDDRMRASDGIWAIGDVTGKGLLTQIALYQGAICAADILGLPSASARYDAAPRVTFTDPEVGAVGISEADAEARGIKTVVAVKQVSATFRGWLHAEGNDGLVKLVFDASDGTLIGATAVGPNGGELVGMLSLAVHERMTLDGLRSLIYAFPTFYGAIGEAIGAYGRGVTTVLDPGYAAIAALDAIGGGAPGHA